MHSMEYAVLVQVARTGKSDMHTSRVPVVKSVLTMQEQAYVVGTMHG